MNGKQLISAVFAIAILLTPMQTIFAATLTSPTILSAKVLHTRNIHNEILRVLTSEPTTLMMWYCLGENASPDTTSQCTWKTQERIAMTKHFVVMNGLVSGETYTYHIQVVDADGLGATIDGSFTN